MPDVVLPGAQPAASLGEEDMPTNVDLKIYQGDYKVWYFELLDQNESVIDISNHTPKCQFKNSFNDLDPILLDASIENNKIKLELTSPKSNSLVESSYIYDIQLTDSGGRVKTYIAGDITVIPQITT